jgi:hypothetical protein
LIPNERIKMLKRGGEVNWANSKFLVIIKPFT